MILQKFLFDFDEVFEKLISFEPIKSSAEDGSLLSELRLSLFSSKLTFLYRLNWYYETSPRLSIYNYVSKRIERMKERKERGGKYNSISVNILATLIGSSKDLLHFLLNERQ